MGRKPLGVRLQCRLNGLTHLPIRPHTARVVMGAFSTAPLDREVEAASCTIPRGVLDLDPGWIVAERAQGGPVRPLHQVAESSWWPATLASGRCSEAIQQLWRHTIAVSLACRTLARETSDPDPDQLVRAGLLHGLGRWAVAAIDPEWIVRWIDEKDPRVRRRWETADLGTDLGDLGRTLAERWGCDPLAVDAAWLHGETDGVLNEAAREPERLALIQEAVRWADATPWSLTSTARNEALPTEPRLRILIAEVQSKCGALFAAADATSHEELMTRENARLRLRLADLNRISATQERLIEALGDSAPDETPESWSSRVGMVWCGEPEVNAARVIWSEPKPAAIPSGTVDAAAVPDAESDSPASADPDATRRPPSWTIPLESRGTLMGEIHLWTDPGQNSLQPRLKTTRVVDAWQSWAARIADRALMERRLQAVVRGSRSNAEGEQERLRSAKLDALAEFAAGAGHELNNPLAVIVGRAQLLLGQAHEPDAARSLNIILNQAQRAHRILRDLMFVARPSEPRPRLCRPAEILRSCVSEFQAESESRGIRLVSELENPDQQIWIDPDAFRHVAQALIRNALQASTSGAKIQVRVSRQGHELRLWVADGGKGITSVEGSHLFDPFFCGRQAGRGLGLGLPRAARIVAMAGGSLNWTSSVGEGSVFQVQLPWNRPPEEPSAKSA